MEGPVLIQEKLVVSKHSCDFVVDPPYYSGKQSILFLPSQHAATNQVQARFMTL